MKFYQIIYSTCYGFDEVFFEPDKRLFKTFEDAEKTLLAEKYIKDFDNDYSRGYEGFYYAKILELEVIE